MNPEQVRRRISPERLIMVGDLAITATYANTLIQSYLEPPWIEICHVRVDEGDQVLRLFRGTTEASFQAWANANIDLMHHRFPWRIEAFPSDEVLAAYVEWSASQIPDNPPDI